MNVTDERRAGGPPPTGRLPQAPRSADPVGPPDTALRTVDFDAFCTRTHADLTRALALALDDREMGRDAAAEGLTRAWMRWSSVSAMDNPAGWVYRVGLNWGRSRLRRRRREVVTAYPPELATPAADYDDSLARAIAALTPRHRDVVIARYYLDWSEAATATALGLPAGTVKSRLSRALTQLDVHVRNAT